ncbi:MAG: phytoene desaturase family protein [Patescibacteria group bacterium]
MTSKKSIIIVGGGLGGLAAAALLSKEGHKVTLLEKNEELGGRARVYKSEGFVFDMGPSWYLMPDIVERFFGLFNKKPEDFMDLKRLDPQYKIFYEDDTSVEVVANVDKNLTTFESLEIGSAKKLKKYFSITTKIYDIATKGEKGFLYKPFNKLTDFLDIKLLELFFTINLFQSYDSFVSKFTKNKKIKQILEFATVFLGGSPKNIPSVYTMMSHVDFVLGGWYPMGGMGKLVDALTSLAKQYGANIITSCEVLEIEIADKLVKKVKTTKGDFASDIVVVNADMHHAETSLINNQESKTYKEKYWENQTMSPSAFLVYLGVKGRVHGLEHHNLFMAADWDKHFDTVFKNYSWPQDPSYYVCCPSVTDKSVAPDGDENIFILVPVAAGLKDDDKTRQEYCNHILRHLERSLKTNLLDRIITKRIYSHRDFMSDYNAYKGTAFAPAHTLWQSVYFRPRMKSKKVHNLYYVGQYTQPGIGMPMVLLSAEFLMKEINKQKNWV